MIRLLNIGFCLMFFGCNTLTNETAQIVENPKPNENKQSELIKLPIDEETTLELIDEKENNTLVLKTKRGDDVISISGCGNSQFIKDSNGKVMIDTLILQTNQKGYLVTSYVNGSTFGAETYFLVYKRNQWLVSRLPFYKMRHFDANNDGIIELVEYKTQYDSVLYNFQSGIIVPFEKTINTK